MKNRPIVEQEYYLIFYSPWATMSSIRMWRVLCPSSMLWIFPFWPVILAFIIPVQRVLWFPSEACNAVKETFRPHKLYIFLIRIARRVYLAMSVRPSVSTQTSLSVLKLSGCNFPKSLISFAGSI